MKGSEFIFDYAHLLHYKCHKISLNHNRSYIGFPYWIKNKNATTNPINKEDKKYFQYAVTVVLNYDEIGKHAEGLQKLNLS